MSIQQQHYVIDLALATERAQVGGKAWHLQRLLSMGMLVPNGFVIPCSAFAHFLTANRLTTQVNGYLAQAQKSSGSEVRAEYETLCAAILAAPLPTEVAEAVTYQADRLLASSPHGLVVRSSAPHEDAANASFAGVYSSYLGIRTHEALWEAIRRGWCAAWSPGALAYAQRMGITLSPAGMAMIVQPLLMADSAGVALTADPLTGNPWQIVINATFGLAQNLVSGSAPADRFVATWDTGEIVEQKIVEKTTMLQVSEQGVETKPVPLALQKQPTLSDVEAHKVAQVALELDRALNCRVELEWVMAQGKLYVVQVRPLTALPPFFPHELSEEETKLTWTPSDPIWLRTPNADERLVAPFFRDRSALELWLRYSPGGSFPQQTGHERDFNGYRYQTAWHWEATPYTVEETIAWLQTHEAEMRTLWLAQQATMQESCLRADETLRNARCAADLIPVLLEVRAAEIDFMAATWGAPQWMIFTCEWLLKEFLQVVAPNFAVGRLLQGLPCLSQTRTEQAQALGRAIVEPTVRSAFIEQPLDQVLPYLVQKHPDSQFLQEYELFCWQFGMAPPTWPAAWSENHNEAQLLLVIKKSLLGEGQEARTLLAQGAIERKNAEAELSALIEQVDLALLSRFDELLAWAHFWTPQLDNRGWLAGYIYVRLRALMRQTGEMLVDEGVLDSSTDLMLLTPDALAQIATATSPAEQRHCYLQCKRDYERNRRLTPPMFLGQPPEEGVGTQVQVQESEQAQASTSLSETATLPESRSARVLQGDGLAPGRVVGVARKSQDLNDALFLDSLTQADILIYPGYRTWPDWLSLFMVVQGVVTVQGVQLHHAAQIARECGVPYVDLPQELWESIPDGARLVVDGTAGIVIVLAD